jgi:heterodisulfide reductase subunit B
LLNLSSTYLRLVEDESYRELVSKALKEIGITYRSPDRVTHLIDVIVNDVGLDRIGGMIVRKLRGIRLASFPGCQLIRPSHIIKIDDPHDPHLLDDVIDLLGGEAINYDQKAKCCGGPALLYDDEIAVDRARTILASAIDRGAEGLIVACPLCQLTLELAQFISGSDHKIPIIYFTQLLGYALGADYKDIGIGYNLISPERVFAFFEG